MLRPIFLFTIKAYQSGAWDAFRRRTGFIKFQCAKLIATWHQAASKRFTASAAPRTAPSI